MLRQLRHRIIETLWQTYCQTTPQMQKIATSLAARGVTIIPLDHFAVIDLPGPKSGLAQMAEIFSALGYLPQGRDYLADKQNEFLWLTEIDSFTLPAKETLPQVVTADFWLDELPVEIRKIILHYSSQAKAAPITKIHQLLGAVCRGDINAANIIHQLVTDYFQGRDWPLPSFHEWKTVHEFNELLAWVLIFGRKPNHFTLPAHLLGQFQDIADFNQFIQHEVGLTLSTEGGIIKGGKASGIAQASTTSDLVTIQLADGEVRLPNGFVEYVWRFPRAGLEQPPILWRDYFTDFVGTQANYVVETLLAG